MFVCLSALVSVIPQQSLHSLLRNIHLVHVKKFSYILRNDFRRHLKDYAKGKSIVDVARGINYPPYMVARVVVENVTSLAEQNVRKAVTEAMRNPKGILGSSDVLCPEYRCSESTGVLRSCGLHGSPVRVCPFSGRANKESSISQSRLSLEVIDAIASDPLYGPRHDRDRHSVGLEYEIILEQALLSMNIPFETEAQLRIKGTARTPDILLSCPVGVRIRRRWPKQSTVNGNLAAAEDSDEYEWKVVCWIDSKALFGDVQTHNSSVLPQAETYVHRFGPGIVLYWFGHAPLEHLGDGHGSVVVMGWNLPDSFILPTGEIAKRGSNSSVSTTAVQCQQDQANYVRAMEVKEMMSPRE